MRLLTEYMSVPEVNGAVVPKASVIEKQAVTVSGEGESIENRNLQLARQVEEHKNELVKALSKLPMTALWLLNKYEQARNKDEQEDEAVISSELNDFLKDIKKHFNAANRDFYAASQSLENRSNAKKRLMNAVQELPFAFEDLVKLVDIVIYAFKFRGISFDGHFCSDQTSKYPATKKHFDIIEQRLEKVCRTARPRLEGHFQAMDLQAYEEMFLFLTVNEMVEIIPNLILAEHYWLGNRQQLATVNSKLVLFIANQYKGNFLDFEDLVQEGHTGLLKAVDRFKYRLGFQFSTYAGYWIRQAISRALSRSERVVRIPCGQIATINKLFRAKDELTLKTGIEPSIQELAEFTNLSQDEVNNILSISQSSVTLEGFEDDDDDQAFAPIDYLQQKVFTQSYSLIAESQLQALVKNAVKTLNAREAKILCSHFGLGTDEQMTLQEIGSELNLTRERVRQIQVVALNKIKMRHGEQLVSFL
jgi:RNA polymerase sigma factor (sigma-70 family)